MKWIYLFLAQAILLNSCSGTSDDLNMVRQTLVSFDDPDHGGYMDLYVTLPQLKENFQLFGMDEWMKYKNTFFRNYIISRELFKISVPECLDSMKHYGFNPSKEFELEILKHYPRHQGAPRFHLYNVKVIQEAFTCKIRVCVFRLAEGTKYWKFFWLGTKGKHYLE